MIFDLFPTAISINEISIQANELNCLLRLANDREHFIKNNNGNFYHEENYILDTVLKDSKLAKDISHYIDEYTVNVLGEDPSLRYTQSWININPPGSSHHKHSHINSIISGVLYLQTNENSGKFLVHKREERTIKNQTKNLNKYNYSFLFFEPQKFDLYLFPSSLEHSVKENKSDENRISLSFNTFYHGTINAYSTLTELKIN
jgi:uncharacterized protein (TIGR02466 family)